jgi:hypothetical protein
MLCSVTIYDSSPNASLDLGAGSDDASYPRQVSHIKPGPQPLDYAFG